MSTSCIPSSMEQMVFYNQSWETFKNKDFNETIWILKKAPIDDLFSFFVRAKLDSDWGGNNRAKYLDRMVCIFEEESAALSEQLCMKIIEIAKEIVMTESHLLTVVSIEGKEYQFPKLALYQSDMFRTMMNSGFKETTSDKPVFLDVSNKILDIFQSIVVSAKMPENLDINTLCDLLLEADKLQLIPLKDRIEIHLVEIISIEDEESFRATLALAQNAKSSLLQKMCQKYCFREIPGVYVAENTSDEDIIGIDGSLFLETTEKPSTQDQLLLVEKTRKLKTQLLKCGISECCFQFSGYISFELIETFFRELNPMIMRVIFCPANEMDPRCYDLLGNLHSLKKL